VFIVSVISLSKVAITSCSFTWNFQCVCLVAGRRT